MAKAKKNEVVEVKKPIRGRPTKFDDSLVEKVYKLALLNLTDDEMADILEINRDTFYTWLKTYPKFSDAVKAGKEYADANIAKRLYNRAAGYTYVENKAFVYQGKPIIVPVEKHMPADPGCLQFWLSNRSKRLWKQRQEIELSTKLVSFNGENDLED